jgi:hypothetical protein
VAETRRGGGPAAAHHLRGVRRRDRTAAGAGELHGAVSELLASAAHLHRARGALAAVAGWCTGAHPDPALAACMSRN